MFPWQRENIAIMEQMCSTRQWGVVITRTILSFSVSCIRIYNRIVQQQTEAIQTYENEYTRICTIRQGVARHT
jgi:hypothetical protein